MKKLQFIDIGKPFRIIGKICKDIERAFRFKGINVNFIVMMIDYIGFAFILKWNLQRIAIKMAIMETIAEALSKAKAENIDELGSEDGINLMRQNLEKLYKKGDK